MRYTIILILALILAAPAHAGDGLWKFFTLRAERAARSYIHSFKHHNAPAAGDLAGTQILQTAEALARHGAHPGERVEMAAGIAAAWLDAGHPAETRRILASFGTEVGRIPSKATRNRALYEIAKGWAALGAVDEVETLVALLPRSDAILAELGAARAAEGDLDAARSLAARVTDEGARGKILGSAARNLSDRGEHQAALALLDEVKDIPWRTSVLQAVGVALAEGGDCKGGRAVADQLLGVPGIDPRTIDLSGGSSRRSPHPKVLAKVATACARGGDVDGGLDAAAALPQGRPQIGALAGIAAATKDDARAREILTEALGRAGELAKPGVRALALASVAQAWKERGDIETSVETLHAAWDAAQEVVKPGLGDARLEILAKLGAAGHCEEAAGLARGFNAPFWRDGALAGAARGCAVSGDKETALALAGETKVPLWRANAYQEIALALLDRGDAVAALDAAARIPSERGRVKALAVVGAAALEAETPISPVITDALARISEDE